MEKIVLFSHGMGLQKDNRGLFTYLSQRITQQYKNVTCILFDYNDVNEAEKTIFLKPFSEQAKLLQQQINKITSEHKKAMLYIVGQSQGCLIPALCDLTGVHKVVGTSPFFHTAMKDILARYSKSKENEINFNGITKRKRTDGTTTIMPAEYWQERFNTDPEALYNNMALKTKLTLICALKDEIMDSTNLTKIKYARIINTDGNHDFSGPFLKVVGDLIIEELSY
jgi:SNF2 family DNA or RNA helicase